MTTPTHNEIEAAAIAMRGDGTQDGEAIVCAVATSHAVRTEVQRAALWCIEALQAPLSDGERAAALQGAFISSVATGVNLGLRIAAARRAAALREDPVGGGAKP